MEFIFEENDISHYLQASDIINTDHPLVQNKIQEIISQTDSDEEQARYAFCFVRDAIRHSFDINSDVITIRASDVIDKGEGICFAKAHLLAALLRGMNIPSGFCYQRVTRKGTPDSGYALHGLNAIYLPSRAKWFRADPRGNKPGVHSEFSIEEERLAYPIRTDLGEVDYPYILAAPSIKVIAAMEESADCHELFFRRPEEINTALER